MSKALAVLAILIFGEQSHAQPNVVRFGLFSLFKPKAVEVRVVSGAAALSAAGFNRRRQLAAGEVVKVRTLGARLGMQVNDATALAPEITETTEISLVSPEPATFELTLPGKITRLVRGQISISATEVLAEGGLKIVLTTDRESAVASIVAAELKGEHSSEALKAVAVVVRTFTLAQSGRHSDEGFDFCDTTHCQLYRGQDDLAGDAESSAPRDAVSATKGQLLTFRGHPIEGFYTAACGGLSATPGMVWGGATGSDYPYQRLPCRWCRGSRHDRWRRSANAAAVLGALSDAIGARLSLSTDIDIASSQGLVELITIRDGDHKHTLKVDQFRRAIGRRLGWNTVLSPSFVIKRQGSRFFFSGRGFGSQVGLCVAGSVAQAGAGRNYRQILGSYYPEAELSTRPTTNE